MRRLTFLSLLCLLAACAPQSHLVNRADGTRALAPCDWAPHCAVSLENPGGGGDSVDAIAAGPDAGTAYTNLIFALRVEPGARIVTDDGRYVHAEFRTPFLRFRDDVEFLIRDDGTIDVRSSARSGYWDWEKNRRRVERLRELIATRTR